ncbi:predicted protein [Histoplasma capsulatum var. duboisii H88]|uniref:Predicted protein n=1 Tax=Ajellomyces capsulatus (strain H88) TaxID=544711 RepID=F0UTW8_AJEC8|nr:predicted protein [Histoplasma capsulatum var. duboisii H88]
MAAALLRVGSRFHASAPVSPALTPGSPHSCQQPWTLGVLAPEVAAILAEKRVPCLAPPNLCSILAGTKLDSGLSSDDGQGNQPSRLYATREKAIAMFLSKNPSQRRSNASLRINARWLAVLLSAYFLADGWHFTPQSAGNTKSHVIDGSICGARFDPPVWIMASSLIINTRLLALKASDRNLNSPGRFDLDGYTRAPMHLERLWKGTRSSKFAMRDATQRDTAIGSRTPLPRKLNTINRHTSSKNGFQPEPASSVKREKLPVAVTHGYTLLSTHRSQSRTRTTSFECIGKQPNPSTTAETRRYTAYSYIRRVCHGYSLTAIYLDMKLGWQFLRFELTMKAALGEEVISPATTLKFQRRHPS